MADKFNLDGFSVDENDVCTADGGFVGDFTGLETKVIVIPSAIGAITSDWTNTVGYATLAASKTAKDFIIPIIGLKIGDVIKSFKVYGQVESAGGAVTVDAVMFRQIAVAGDPTQTDIGSITQVAVTADTLIESSKTLAAEETVATNESFIIGITGTTAASTDIAITSVEVTVN